MRGVGKQIVGVPSEEKKDEVYYVGDGNPHFARKVLKGKRANVSSWGLLRRDVQTNSQKSRATQRRLDTRKKGRAMDEPI